MNGSILASPNAERRGLNLSTFDYLGGNAFAWVAESRSGYPLKRSVEHSRGLKILLTQSLRPEADNRSLPLAEALSKPPDLLVSSKVKKELCAVSA
jgi:hypothetical protein